MDILFNTRVCFVKCKKKCFFELNRMNVGWYLLQKITLGESVVSIPKVKEFELFLKLKSAIIN